MERKLTTIIAMDVVGYSRLMEIDEQGTFDRLKDARLNIIDPSIARHSGRTVKLMGDGALAEFPSVVGALQCAVEIQRQFASRHDIADGMQRLQFRIGLHLGDVIVEGDDIYGDGVNVASRLESISQPGGIVLSKQVHDHIGANVPVRFISLAEQTVKNISRPIQAYRVDFGADAVPAHVIRFRNFELDTAHFEVSLLGLAADRAHLRQAGDRLVHVLADLLPGPHGHSPAGVVDPLLGPCDQAAHHRGQAIGVPAPLASGLLDRVHHRDEGINRRTAAGEAVGQLCRKSNIAVWVLFIARSRQYGS